MDILEQFNNLQLVAKIIWAAAGGLFLAGIIMLIIYRGERGRIAIGIAIGFVLTYFFGKTFNSIEWLEKLVWYWRIPIKIAFAIVIFFICVFLNIWSPGHNERKGVSTMSAVLTVLARILAFTGFTMILLVVLSLIPGVGEIILR